MEVSLNEEIINLWSQTFTNENLALQPMLYPKLEKNSLLFIGCNPSFNEIGFKSTLRDTEHVDLDFSNFYLWKNNDHQTLEVITKLEIEGKLKHNYFKKFREISKDLDLHWEHIDLFFVRETSQKKLISQVLGKNKKLNEFGKRQLEITKKAISLIQPRIVVIANAFAADIFQQETPCFFNEKVGCHFFDVNKKSTPVFFTSMLAGQRALDKGSFARLKWHLKKVVSET